MFSYFNKINTLLYELFLSDTIEAVEYDFGLRLSIMLGQVWSQTGNQALSDLIKAERDLFKTWWRQGHQGVHTFSQLYLWSMGRKTCGLEGNQGMLAPDDLGSRPDSGNHSLSLGK